MKIAYLSVYRDGTGYANAAINNILALEAGGFDVVCRPVTLTGIKDKNSPVQHLENKDMQDVDVCIQHILPSMFQYKSGVKNIGFFAWETSHFRRSNWAHCCNLMDEIWVPCEHNKQACIDSGVTVPIKVFPHSCRLAKFQQELKPLPIKEAENKFVFYTVGEMTKRKNFASLIRSYYTAFTNRDDVLLLIKTNVPGKSDAEGAAQLKAMCDQIKTELHIYGDKDKYPKIAIATRRLLEEDLARLHVTCDCFVLPSRGEAWAIPAHDAMGFGNPVLLSNHGGFIDLVGESAGKDSLIEGQMTPCFGMSDGMKEIYTGDEYWFDPSIPDLVSKMQTLYYVYTDEGNMLPSLIAESVRDQAFKFSHQEVGKIAKELLDAKSILVNT